MSVGTDVRERDGMRPGAAARAFGFLRRALEGPTGVVVLVAAIALALGWQFTDPTRSVPALDAPWYQWRAEFLLANDPHELITLRGAGDALAGGYRVAEPVLAALTRIVGGVAQGTPTVLLSVLFRVLCVVGIAAFAWQHRRDRLLLYLTLLVAPPLFLLQRFFGFLDNFFSLALVAGVLLLLEPMRTSWLARAAAVVFLYLAGLSHPTTLALFLLSQGALAGYRVVRERSLRAALRSEGPLLWAGAIAVALMVGTWLGGLWGPSAGLGEAAVPPPQPVSYFVQRTLAVLRNMFPLVLAALIAVGIAELTRSAVRRSERFAEVTLVWMLPLVGMLGFLLGAAYPYFRFFNATLAPILVTAVGLTWIVRAPRRVERRGAPVLTIVVGLGVALLLGSWWRSGLGMWNSSGSWLTPEVGEQMAAARAYLASTPGDTAVFVIDAQPDPEIVPYGEYKEYTNSIYAELAGSQIDDAVVFFGRIEDLVAGRPTTLGDLQYDRLSAGTASEALAAMGRGDAMVLAPTVFNQYSTNPDFMEECLEGECVEIGDSGLHVLPGVSGTPLSQEAATSAQREAERARAFRSNPPGPLSDLAGTLAAGGRVALLFLLPGWLLYRRLPGVSWVEGLALVPLLSMGVATVAGVVALALLRGPLTPTVGWSSWAIAVAIGMAPLAARRRRGRGRGTLS